MRISDWSSDVCSSDLLARLTDGAPNGSGDIFLAKVRQQVLARAREPDSPYGLECPTRAPVDGLIEAAQNFATGLARTLEPFNKPAHATTDNRAAEPTELNNAPPRRIQGAIRCHKGKTS